MASRLSRIDIEDVKSSVTCNGTLITIAGNGRWKKDGSKALFGMSIYTDDKGVHLSGFTCSYEDEKELIEVATAPVVPDVNFPDYVALLLGYNNAFELYMKHKAP